MIKKRLLVYFMVITIPLFLGLCVWQANRYISLKFRLDRLEKVQVERVEQNKKLIADIAIYSSPERIERIARNELNLYKIRPEDVLQIKIEGGKGHDL
jgi:cell division protein FtsL